MKLFTYEEGRSHWIYFKKGKKGVIFHHRDDDGEPLLECRDYSTEEVEAFSKCLSRFSYRIVRKWVIEDGRYIHVPASNEQYAATDNDWAYERADEDYIPPVEEVLETLVIDVPLQDLVIKDGSPYGALPLSRNPDFKASCLLILRFNAFQSSHPEWYTHDSVGWEEDGRFIREEIELIEKQ